MSFWIWLIKSIGSTSRPLLSATHSTIELQSTPLTSFQSKLEVFGTEAIIDFITQSEGSSADKQTPQDSLTLKTFIKKFNSAYKKDLHTEQKNLLNKYVASFADNGIDLKIYLNEEIKRLKDNLTKGLTSEDIKEKSEITDKTKKVLTLMEEYKSKEIDSRMIEQVLKIQSLAREIA